MDLHCRSKGKGQIRSALVRLFYLGMSLISKVCLSSSEAFKLERRKTRLGPDQQPLEITSLKPLAYCRLGLVARCGRLHHRPNWSWLQSCSHHFTPSASNFTWICLLHFEAILGQFLAEVLSSWDTISFLLPTKAEAQTLFTLLPSVAYTILWLLYLMEL